MRIKLFQDDVIVPIGDIKKIGEKYGENQNCPIGGFGRNPFHNKPGGDNQQDIGIGFKKRKNKRIDHTEEEDGYFIGFIGLFSVPSEHSSSAYE